jgi:Zn-finger nucleic acid-binding protein
MNRGFYSSGHLVEVDRCGSCGLTWFDQDELEMLQCLIENRIVPDLPGESASVRAVLTFHNNNRIPK